MARLSRITQLILGSGAANNGVFGSAQANGGPGTISNVISTIMGLPAWIQGWLSATEGASKFPCLEELQGVDYVVTTQLAYILQQGIPEYDPGTTYYHYNMCINPGTFQIYGSVADNNTGNALTNPAYWTLLLDLTNTSGFSTGDVKLTMKTAADAGWVLCNDGTIGNAASGGTARANADTVNLFTLLWTNVSNTYAPVSGGRGASAAADFAANKTIGLTPMLGRALALSGTGAGLTARTLGETFGEENHQLTTAELAQHNHGVTDPGHSHTVPLAASGSGTNFAVATPGPQAGSATTSTSATGITTQNAGSNTAHNTMQPTAFLNAMIKL